MGFGRQKLYLDSPTYDWSDEIQSQKWLVQVFEHAWRIYGWSWFYVIVYRTLLRARLEYNLLLKIIGPKSAHAPDCWLGGSRVGVATLVNHMLNHYFPFNITPNTSIFAFIQVLNHRQEHKTTLGIPLNRQKRSARSVTPRLCNTVVLFARDLSFHPNPINSKPKNVTSGQTWVHAQANACWILIYV